MLDLKHIMKIKLKDVGERLTQHGPHLAAGTVLPAEQQQQDREQEEEDEQGDEPPEGARGAF